MVGSILTATLLGMAALVISAVLTTARTCHRVLAAIESACRYQSI